MKAYRITVDQEKQIKNTPFGKNQYINPVKDINGEPFIFEHEMEYLATNKSWKRAVLTEFIPPIQEDIL